jgi:hemerythrin-like domain-containing protein
MTLALDPTTMPPALEGWLAAHTALRRDAVALRQAVDALAPTDSAGAARLADAFVLTSRMLHEHHVTEDELVFPELIARSPAFAGAVMTMSLEHVDLDGLIDDISRALAVLTANTSRNVEVHARLAHKVELFETIVQLHLEVEEEHALPLMMRCFTTEELDAIGDQHLVRGAAHIDEMIPWVASALPTELVTQMLAGMPPMVQENYSRWMLAFQQTYAPMLAPPAHAVAA